MRLRFDDLQFIVALLLVGFGVGCGFSAWHGVSAVGALLALDHMVDRWRVER